MPSPPLPPSALDGPAAWLGPEMLREPDRWLVTLSRRDIEELERAARHYLSLGRDVGEIAAADFPLERFTDRLKALRNTLLHGCGVELLHGLPIEGYSQEFAATVLCGIGAHLGNQLLQCYAITL